MSYGVGWVCDSACNARMQCKGGRVGQSAVPWAAASYTLGGSNQVQALSVAPHLSQLAYTLSAYVTTSALLSPLPGCCCCLADMLLAPGPAAEVVMPGPLLAGLLQRLKADGYVPEVWQACI